MLLAPPSSGRSLKTEKLNVDLCIVGGGLAGTCAAITAARAGLKVALVQDRPVLGGNASSEVRLWSLGATSHMGSCNRFSREGGVANEILLENLYRNPEGNALIFDTVLLEKVVLEKNITLLLNTAAHSCDKAADDPDRIAAVHAFCSQNSTAYTVEAPLFLDSSGDGILGFLSGAAFRMGSEKKAEFNEPFAREDDFGHLLGHSIYFYSKDAGRPIKFTPPSYALRDVDQLIPRYKDFSTKEYGCRLWWIEWGGRLDTIHETEKIKWELWGVVYGVWDYIKNSGNFPEAEHLTLEWVGHIPGKRESRRFEGPYILSQSDIVERKHHDDAVAFGGWSIDLHPADGVFAKIAGSHHLHSKGVYQIPFRSYYSRNIKNLFLAGRLISTTHVAFGSTRVMLTCALGGQAVAAAAALCREDGCLPADISADPAKVRRLQRALGRVGHDQWALPHLDNENLATKAKITASSSLRLTELPSDVPPQKLEKALAQMVPLKSGRVPSFTFFLDVSAPAELTFELRTTSRPDHHAPDVILASTTKKLEAGEKQAVTLDFGVALPTDGYVFYTIQPGANTEATVNVHQSSRLVTGLQRLWNPYREMSARLGGEDYDIFCPARRPKPQNLAFTLGTPTEVYGPENVANGFIRPHRQPNAWVADLADPSPSLSLEWEEPQTISRIDLFFDCDYDHALESVLWGQPENRIPHCARRWRLLDGKGNLLHESAENHLAQSTILLEKPVTTYGLKLEVLEMNGLVPATVMEVRCYR